MRRAYQGVAVLTAAAALAAVAGSHVSKNSKGGKEQAPVFSPYEVDVAAIPLTASYDLRTVARDIGRRVARNSFKTGYTAVSNGVPLSVGAFPTAYKGRTEYFVSTGKNGTLINAVMKDSNSIPQPETTSGVSIYTYGEDGGENDLEIFKQNPSGEVDSWRAFVRDEHNKLVIDTAANPLAITDLLMKMNGNEVYFLNRPPQR